MAIPAFLNTINTTEPFASWATEKKQAIRDDLAEMWGYQDTINEQPNPESKADFCDRMILGQLKIWLNNYRRQRAEAEVTYEVFEEA